MGIYTTTAFRPGLLAGVSILVLSQSACVTQKRYDESHRLAENYRVQLQDLNSYSGELVAENERLRGELDLYRGKGTIEAAATKDIDERLEQLQGLVGSLGASPGEVTLMAVEGGYGLRLSDSVLFDSGSAEIKPEGQALLAKMAAEITQRKFERVWVRGHTDSDPVVKAETKKRFPHGNMELSAKRALEVAALLVETGGLPMERVIVAGFGPGDPISPNTSADAKRKNRRVDIFVIQDAEADGQK
jgi:flagellar motor protein MotB